MVSSKKTLKQKNKEHHLHEEDMALSKNHGRSIRYLKRLAEEREAKVLYEDGLKAIDNNDDIMRNG